MTLGQRAFAHYDVHTENWEVLTGNYRIFAGNASDNTPLSAEVTVQGTVETMGYSNLPGWYIRPQGKPTVKDFEKIYGQEIKPFELEKPGSFTLLNTFNDMKENPVVQQIIQGMTAGILAGYGGDETNAEYIFTISIILNTPLIRLVQQGGGQTPLALMQAAVGAANGDEAAMQMLGDMMAAQA